MQRSVRADPDKAGDADAQDERKYEIDQARKMRENPGMTKDEARVAVDRDNLAASIRHGLVRADAEELVAKMTDAQVTALCPNGNPPCFETAKRIKGGTRKEPKYEPERWNHGKRGGVVHVKRDADAWKIAEITKTTEPQIAADRAARWLRGERGIFGGDFGGADKATLDEIEKLTGAKPSTNAASFVGKDLRHTFDRHGAGKEKQKDQDGITAADVAIALGMLNNHDSAKQGNGNKRNGRIYPTVVYTATIGGVKPQAVFTVASKLYLHSTWEKKRRNTG